MIAAVDSQEFTLQVIRAAMVADRVCEITLGPVSGGRLPGWQAGAHIRLRLPDGSDRPYSLVNLDPAPGATAAPDSWRLGVLLEPASRGGSVHMHGLRAGDMIVASPPRNNFTLDAKGGAPLLIAGGIGITPIASMAAALVAQGRGFDLHYAGRTAAAMAFVPELQALCGGALHLHRDDAADRLDLGAIFGALDAARPVHVCGPKGLIDAVCAATAARGIPDARVHYELFTAEPLPEGGDTAFEVEIAATGAVHVIPPGRTIIEILEAAGMDLMYDCQRGDCGICQCPVVAGEPDHRDVILTPAERASGKVMQICVSRARSPRLVLDL